jgi:hypothetical protein
MTLDNVPPVRLGAYISAGHHALNVLIKQLVMSLPRSSIRLLYAEAHRFMRFNLRDTSVASEGKMPALAKQKLRQLDVFDCRLQEKPQ